MMYHDKLYAVKNDRGEFAYIEMDELTWEMGFATVWLSLNKPYAERTSSDYGGHVVELAEAPAKIVVSEDEAEMLEWAKDDYCAASVISAYSTEHIGAMGQDRLMRAYVNGWVVEKPKLWNVKVPHTEHVWYFKRPDNPGVLGVRQNEGLLNDHDARFTEAEVEHYGLQDCKKAEVTDDGE